MASPTYTPQGATPDIWVTSPTTVEDVQMVSGLTSPSNVYFSLPVNIGTWQNDQGNAAMTAVAGAIESILTFPNVAGAYYTQDLDANGLIAAFLNITVSIPPISGSPGPWTAVVQYPIQQLTQPFSVWTPQVEALIAPVVAQLQAAQAGTSVAPPSGTGSPPGTPA